MHVDPSNKVFFDAFRAVEEGGQNIFLTGKAGTGKTTFLKYLREHSKKNLAIVAPTGIAAVNAGGMTIHSLFQINPRKIYYPGCPQLEEKGKEENGKRISIFDEFQYRNSKREILQNIELLVIDEISMVRCELFDLIDKLLRTFGGGNKGLPFGGKQIVVIGDLFQLPPVVLPNVQNILNRFYEGFFFFHSRVFSQCNLKCFELVKIYRQESDKKFANLLNEIREGTIQQEQLNELNKQVQKNFNFIDSGYITLCPTRSEVDSINEVQLNKNPNPEFKYYGTITGNYSTYDLPTDKVLRLKEGEQVMFIKNDTGSNQEYYNGSIGTIHKLLDSTIKVKLKSGKEIQVEKESWEKIEYSWDVKNKKLVEKTVGTFTQYPLKLAWALTIHKSQGLTFDKVYAKLARVFGAGQAYVALSRCTSLKGLVLETPLNKSNIITNPQVIEFYDCNCQSEEEEIPPEVPLAKPVLVEFRFLEKELKKGIPNAIIWQVDHTKEIKIFGPGFSKLEKRMGATTFIPTESGTIELLARDETSDSFITLGTLSVQLKEPLIKEGVDPKPNGIKETPTPPTGIDDIPKKPETTPEVEPEKKPEPEVQIVSFHCASSFLISGKTASISWKTKHAHEVLLLVNEEKRLLDHTGTMDIPIKNRGHFRLVATRHGQSEERELKIPVIQMPEITSIQVPALSMHSRLEITYPPIDFSELLTFDLGKDSAVEKIQSDISPQEDYPSTQKDTPHE